MKYFRWWAVVLGMVAILGMFASPRAHAALTDIKFGQYQIADSQWNVSSCLYTATCQIYSKNPGTAYKIPWTTGQLTWATGDYVKFELTGDTTNPYVAKQYDSNGNLKATMGTGHIVNMGADYFFFVGNDNNTGQLFSGSSGMSDTSGVTWTGTLNPTVAQADTYANATYSTVPLTSGQTATITPSSAPPAPTCNPCSPNINNTNFGFEAGTTANWTVSNGTGTEKAATGWSANGAGVNTTKGITNYSPGGGKTWNVTPYGTYMMAIQAGAGSPQFDPAMTSLGLTSTEITNIRNYLTSLGGNSNPTNASWAKRTVTLQAGVTYTIAWQYLSTDYVPFNDGSAMTLVHSTDASKIPTLNNIQQRYALLGFTNPGTGNYATNSYGSTGWQLATITVPVSGDYVLGFTSFNLGDTALSPILLVDDLQGATTLNGTTFNPIPPNEGSLAPSAGPTTPTLCCGGSAAPFDADPAKVLQVQGFLNRTTADSIVYIDQIGNSNTITVQQTGTKQNYVNYEGNGSFNTVNITQSGNASTTVNYVDLVVGSTTPANSNTVNITQTSTGGSKAAFVNISDSNNSLTLQQKDAGSHWADVTLTGGNKTVSIIQQGSAGHMANVNLGGTATTLDLTQSGSTQQHYSISHTCATAGGCGTITVNQGQ